MELRSVTQRFGLELLWRVSDDMPRQLLVLQGERSVELKAVSIVDNFTVSSEVYPLVSAVITDSASAYELRRMDRMIDYWFCCQACSILLPQDRWRRRHCEECEGMMASEVAAIGRSLS